MRCLPSLGSIPGGVLGRRPPSYHFTVTGGMFPGWDIVLAPFLEAMLWPVASVMLLAPQRRAPDPDENRPL